MQNIQIFLCTPVGLYTYVNILRDTFFLNVSFYAILTLIKKYYTFQAKDSPEKYLSGLNCTSCVLLQCDDG